MSVRPRLAVMAALAAAGTAAGAYYLWPSGRQLAACPPLHAPVPAAAQKALAAYTGRIRHDVERSGGGMRDESWYDSVTGVQRQVSFDSRGRITSEFGTIRSGREVDSVWVMYEGRKWFSEHDRSARIADPNAAAVIAQSYRDRVAQGKVKVIGQQLIGGHQTLKVHETVKPPPPPLFQGIAVPHAFPTLRIDTWIDRLTYVPLRTRTVVRGHWSQVDSTWLPRTPANVAETKLVIPAGFKHFSPSAHGFDTILTAVTSGGCRQS